MRGKSLSLVSSDALINNRERGIEVATNEYVNLKHELNMATINLKNVRDQLNLMEHAQMPDEPEPSKKIIISVFRSNCCWNSSYFNHLFVSYFDTSLASPTQFEKFTKLDILGKMNKVKTKDLDLTHLYNSNGKSKKFRFL